MAEWPGRRDRPLDPVRRHAEGIMPSRNSLERAANIAILALVPICAASWIYYFVATPTTARARTTAPPPKYAQGETLGDVAELASLPATPTVLLFLNSNCRFCTENMPFYRRLLEQTRAQGQRLRVVAASREPLTSLEGTSSVTRCNRTASSRFPKPRLSNRPPRPR